jgi:hypothetical protein
MTDITGLSRRTVLTTTDAEVRAWLAATPPETLADLTVAELVERMREALGGHESRDC